MVIKNLVSVGGSDEFDSMFSLGDRKQMYILNNMHKISDSWGSRVLPVESWPTEPYGSMQGLDDVLFLGFWCSQDHQSPAVVRFSRSLKSYVPKYLIGGKENAMPGLKQGSMP